MALGSVLRSLGSVLNPQVAQEMAQEEQQKRATAQQIGMFGLQQQALDKRHGEDMAMRAAENTAARQSRETLARDTAARETARFEQTMDMRRDQLSFQRDQALRAAKTAEERAATDKWFREQTLKLQQDGLRLRETLAQGTNQQVVGNEAKLRDDYNQLSKTFIGVRDAHQRVMASANDPSAAGDLALIFNYMKVLDPTSVVRESEFAQAARTGAFGERIKSAVEQVISGKRLSNEIRRDFLDRSGRLYSDAETNQVDLEKRFTDISTRSKVNPENVVIPYRTSKSKSKEPKETGSLEFEGYRFPDQKSLDAYKKAKGL